MPSFSQTQKLLDTETWEGLHFLDENTVAHQLAAEKLREIVSRLYTDIPDGDLNDLDFYIFDNPEANAFFMPKESRGKKITINGKNIIAVSKGLLDICENEDELAGVVAHELNHYRWAKTIGGKNTVYQEQGADVAAVKLLMSAGYNPAHWVNQIIVEPYNMKPNSKELNKPQAEVDAIKKAEADDMTLGISNKYVKQRSPASMATAALIHTN